MLIDGLSTTPKNQKKQEADKFAAFSLMPAIAIIAAFLKFLKLTNFILRKHCAGTRGDAGVGDLRARCRRGLANELAQAVYYEEKELPRLRKYLM